MNKQNWLTTLLFGKIQLNNPYLVLSGDSFLQLFLSYGARPIQAWLLQISMYKYQYVSVQWSLCMLLLIDLFVMEITEGWKQGNNRQGNADDWEEMIKNYIHVSCMQLFVEFADLEVSVLIILHTSVKRGQKIYLKRPALSNCLQETRDTNLCYLQYCSTTQRSGVWSLNGFGSAYSFSIYLLTTVSKTFLFSVPHINVVTKNLDYVLGKLLM